MKLRDYHYEFLVDLPNEVERIELNFTRDELRKFQDYVRDLRAKANRLCTAVESFDREMDFDTLNEWQISAQIMVFNMHSTIQQLCNWQDRIINYERLRIKYQKQKEAVVSCR